MSGNIFLKSNLKVAIIARTKGLEYDDRIRKESLAISKVAQVHIFVTFENNRSESGMTSYGIPYTSITLKSRVIFPSAKFLALKAFEYFWKVNRHLDGYDLIWAHEEYAFLFPLLKKKETVLWDLHEIPEWFLQPKFHKIFHKIEEKALKIVHANKFRIDYLNNSGLITNPPKHDAIRNYPDGNFIHNDEKHQDAKLFFDWLKDNEYVFIQGISTNDRYPFQSISSVLHSTKMKIAVIGSVSNDVKMALSNEFGPLLNDRVYFTGMLDQMVIPVFMKHAKFSMIFYSTDKPNQRFCEPNRFFQILSFGVPVICGNNEPMKEVISNHQCGISLESDGRSIEEISNSILKLLDNYSYYSKNAKNSANLFRWSDQSIIKLLEQSQLVKSV